jgi:hypothetical protein
MAHNDQIRPLADVPDHGFGLLGGLAHSVLADYADAVPPVPRLHLGQNTLPNPPFPMAARVPFVELLESWGPCDGNLAAFLAAAGQHLRDLPIPDASEFSQSARVLQRVLRFDAIAIAWPSPGALDPCAPEPFANPGGEPDPGMPTVITVAVDRAGKALYGWMPQAGSAADIELTGEGLTANDPIVALLLDVLLAQYEWTCKVFGLVS